MCEVADRVYGNQLGQGQGSSGNPDVDTAELIPATQGAVGHYDASLNNGSVEVTVSAGPEGFYSRHSSRTANVTLLHDKVVPSPLLAFVASQRC